VVELAEPFTRQPGFICRLRQPDQFIVSHAGDSTPLPLSVAPIRLRFDNSDGIIWL
jgi:hypothetical protein